MQNIIIATVKEWNISNYFLLKEQYKNFNFILITNKEELRLAYLEEISPKYIFFPHWSWIIPENIYEKFECIVFHMTDLPYGRGGSPLQNLIINEVYETKISAIKVEEGLDTGGIYLKVPLDISIGSAEENFIHMSKIIFTKMIPEFLKGTLIPQKQFGKSKVFKRRTSSESNLQTIKISSLLKLYDFIRMLDADGYPKAYLILDNVKIEFSEVHLKNKKLVGRFEVIENE